MQSSTSSFQRPGESRVSVGQGLSTVLLTTRGPTLNFQCEQHHNSPRTMCPMLLAVWICSTIYSLLADLLAPSNIKSLWTSLLRRVKEFISTPSSREPSQPQSECLLISMTRPEGQKGLIHVTVKSISTPATEEIRSGRVQKNVQGRLEIEQKAPSEASKGENDEQTWVISERSVADLLSSISRFRFSTFGKHGPEPGSAHVLTTKPP